MSPAITNYFRDFLSRYISLNNEILFQDILAICTAEHYLSETTIDYNQTHHAKHIYIIYKGIARGLSKMDNGKDMTLEFYSRDAVMSSSHSLLLKLPSKITFEFIQPSSVIKLDFEAFEKLSEQYPILEKLRSNIIKELMIKSCTNIKMHLNYTLKERYLAFYYNNPHEYKNIPLKYIASYLGIRQQSLSRIRKEMSRGNY